MDQSDYYWRLVNTPLYWQENAREFVCAANLLRRHYRANPKLGLGDDKSERELETETYTDSGPVVCLYVVAIENLLKAIIVASGQDPIDEDGKLETWFKTHNLRRLAQLAKVEGLHEARLEQLTQFATAGKYPVGVRDGDGFSAHNYFPDSVLAFIEDVLTRLEDRLGEVATDRDKKPKTDLNRLCVEDP